MTDNQGWTSARIGQDLRESDDRADLDESPSHWWVPFIDDRAVLRSLLIFKQSYNRERMADYMDVDPVDAPARCEETRLFRQVFRTSAGMGIDRALRKSDVDRQSAMVGLDQSSDAGGTSKLLEFCDRIREGYIGYMFGSMGSGKTDFAVLTAELLSRMRDEIEIGSNIKSFSRAETIERYETLQGWVRTQDDIPRLFVWDEASSNASGYAQDASDVIDKFRMLLQSFRKNSCNLLIIGHTGKDVHPHIRRQCDDVIHKESKKDVTLYDSVEEGNGVGRKMEISGIEPTGWEYDTKEMSRWFWES